MSEAVTTAAPTPNGASGPQKTVTPTPVAKDTAAGLQTPSRGPDGKFAPTKQEAKPDAAPVPKQKLRIKDLEMDEDAAYAEIQRARNSSKLLTEAQKRAERAEQLERQQREREAALEDPRTLVKSLRERGWDDEKIKDHLSRVMMSEFIEPEQMTAEQRRIRELEAKLAEEDDRKKSEAEKARQAEEQKMSAEAEAALESELEAAIEAGKVPKSKAAIRRVSQKLLQLEARGLKLPLEQVVSLVRDDVGKETGEFASSASVDELRDLWGDAAWKAHVSTVLQWAMQKAQPRAAQMAAPRPRPAQPEVKKKLTPQEFDELMRGGGRR